MKTLAIVITVGASLAFGGCSGTETPPQPEVVPASAASADAGADVAEIERLEREWVAAIVKKDAATIERLLAEDFVGTSPTAHTYTKPMAVADLTSGTYVVTSMDLDEVSANVYGDTAVAFTSQEEQSAYGGQDTSGHYHFTNVWVRHNGTWRVVASHGSRYARPHS